MVSQADNMIGKRTRSCSNNMEQFPCRTNHHNIGVMSKCRWSTVGQTCNFDQKCTRYVLFVSPSHLLFSRRNDAPRVTKAKIVPNFMLEDKDTSRTIIPAQHISTGL